MKQREKYQERKIRLAGSMQVETALLVIKNAPVDMANPVEVVVREVQKTRKPDQNALMWAGPLKDISEQAWVGGRTYPAKVWHEEFKSRYLPEEFDPELCKEGYRKWDYTPSGDRVLVGSTTQLTVKGMAWYMEQVYADGASMGVMFRAKEAA